jgi:hypothetical protein
MSKLNDIIKELCAILAEDFYLMEFAKKKYGKELTIHIGDHPLNDLPIKDLPLLVVQDSFEEEKRRFLFTETETLLLVDVGILQKDIETAHEEMVALKDLIKLAIKKNPLLNGKVSYATVSRCKKHKNMSHPLYFIQLTVYVNYTST